MPVSFKARVISGVLRLIKFKNIIAKMSLNPKRTKKGFIPTSISKAYKTESFVSQGKNVVIFEKEEKVSNQHIVFLHGGAYIFEISGAHWSLVQEIVKRTSVRMSVVDYPLGPESKYQDTFNMLGESYDILVNKYPDDDFIFMGDSAGGGLALAFNQKLILEQYKKLPIKLILFSPWIDLTMSNPEVSNYESVDVILSLTLLKNGAEMYAGNADLKNPLLSPINGGMEGLPEMLVFYGTNEVLYPDGLKWKEQMSHRDDFHYREFADMQHDWVIFPIPERAAVINEVCTFIEKNQVSSG